MNGRQYFAKLARQMHLAGLHPDDVQRLDPLDLKRGPLKSKLGGRITIDLKRLAPEETDRRRKLSEEFLKQPVERVPAEEDPEG